MIIGLDVGTTNTKAILFDDTGKAWASAKKGYSLDQPQPGYAEQDPAIVLAAVKQTVREIGRQAQTAGWPIEALAISTAMHSVLLLDQQRQPLTPIITWADNRSAAIAAEWQQGPQAAVIYQRTGTPVHPMTPLCKLRWLQLNQADLYQQATYISDLKSYLCWQLTQEFVIDTSLASATGFYNWQRETWDDTLLDMLALTPDELPHIVPITQQLTLTEQLAQELHLPKSLPIIVGASDGALSNLGLAASQSDQIALTIGTSGAVRMISSKPHLDPEGRLFCYQLRKNQWLIGGPVNNGGIILQWADQNLATTTTKNYQPLWQVASESPAGAHGLLFYPYLNGERAPLWDAAASGSFIGLTQRHQRSDLLRSVLEGVTLNLSVVYQQIIALTGPVTTIHAAGGFARSTLWCQLVADVFDQNVMIPTQVESSSLGAAIVGWQSLRHDPTFGIPAQSEQTYQPQPASQKVYRQLLPLWKNIGQSLTQQYQTIANWQQNLNDEQPKA
ncbi:gluconokinase [Lapidilactobacillus wuchangensis]|uniref:gluconokinase n=1 Tax=Lapidilactobacillus wuchangensis TaxID=2486001 RepID=UPI000F797E04|nr:gluconokinase [Lapidilactobacillus wuchangensis]